MLIQNRKQKKKPVDYYALFTIGIIWLPFGFILDNLAFTNMGAVFMIIRMAVMILLGLIALACMVILIMFNRGML